VIKIHIVTTSPCSNNHYCGTCTNKKKREYENPCRSCCGAGNGELCYWEKDIHLTQEIINETLNILNKLSDEERLEVFSHFCKYCGCSNPYCQCSNDD
jgi:hypothetical protein